MVSMLSERGLPGVFFYVVKRIVVGCIALALILAALVASFGLVGLGIILKLGERDFTLSSGTFHYWPESFPSIDLLYEQNTFYIVAGALLLFLGLPLILTILEQLFVWTEPRRS
ncbi:MAG TPA: hypothetical protein PLA90_11320 [Candidatus Sumerlaeota bacterium]|nr:hypothetical protein [Candidatus Sumerlaeota bacterium]